MELHHLKGNIYYFHGAVNIGYICGDSQKTGMLIDAGLDASAAKKARKMLKSKGLPITHLFLTHSHADHFGGAHHLQKEEGLYTIAPAIEESIMRSPILEPVYLMQGSTPLPEMRNKYLEPQPVTIHEVCEEGLWTFQDLAVKFMALPGHSYNQFGVMCQDILFAADAYFGKKALEKHVIPFIVDADKTIQTLNQLLEIKTEGMIPGHGEFEENPKETIRQNLAVHMKLYEVVLEYMRHKKNMQQEHLIAYAFDYFGVQPQNLAAYTLFRTAVSSFILKGINDGFLSYDFQGGLLHVIWKDEASIK